MEYFRVCVFVGKVEIVRSVNKLVIKSNSKKQKAHSLSAAGFFLRCSSFFTGGAKLGLTQHEHCYVWHLSKDKLDEPRVAALPLSADLVRRFQPSSQLKA
ncbi:hypothetical protein D3C87_1211970 [compost metagenome]